MLKFLIGPTLVGGGYIAASIYGADAEQVVQRSPGETYAAVETAIANVPQSGVTYFEGGSPMPYELKVGRSSDLHLTIALFFAGLQGAEADLEFRPKNGAKETLIVAKIHSDHAVLRSALRGTGEERLAYAPDWMLNLSLRPLLHKLGAQIEEGEPAEFEGLADGSDEAQWEGNLSSEQRQQLSEWQQHQATQPLVNPNADAEKYLSGGKSN